MGQFLNPGNEAFREMRNARIYVDKTGVIEYTNQVLGTPQKYICNSRPRRFGKSYTADMLTAYYSRGCDSRDLFCGLSVEKTGEFGIHINQYDVIHLDIQWFLTTVDDQNDIISYISESVLEELRQEFTSVSLDGVTSLPFALSKIYAETGKKFVIIVDEWDVLIRDDAGQKQIQESYINFLRGLFKGSEPTKYIQLAWLTGILPIKKLKTQSALNNFDEYTMLESGPMTPYIGFTEKEVKQLCTDFHRDFSRVKQWYDGYLLDGEAVYNPRAVVGVMLTGKYKSYWSATGTYETILPLIKMDFKGLKASIIEMLSGSSVPVDTRTFQNDTTHFSSRDDVITYLIHLGYIGYEQERQTAFIPNEEIRQELTVATESAGWDDFIGYQQESQKLLDDTLNMKEEEVAEELEKIHREYASSIAYHDENSLSNVLTVGYLSSMRYYFRPIREFPTGRGFADFVYLPKPEYLEQYPALVIELKWNKSAQTALNQIREKQYPSSIQAYTGNILLVGINYDRKTKKHSCRIEQVEK